MMLRCIAVRTGRCISPWHDGQRCALQQRWWGGTTEAQVSSAHVSWSSALTTPQGVPSPRRRVIASAPGLTGMLLILYSDRFHLSYSLFSSSSSSALSFYSSKA